MEGDAKRKKEKKLPLVHTWRNTWRYSTVIEGMQWIYRHESWGFRASHHSYLLVRAVIPCNTIYLWMAHQWMTPEKNEENNLLKRGLLWSCYGCHGDKGVDVLLSEIARKISESLCDWESLIFSSDVHVTAWNELNKSFICILYLVFDLQLREIKRWSCCFQVMAWFLMRSRYIQFGLLPVIIPIAWFN